MNDALASRILRHLHRGADPAVLPVALGVSEAAVRGRMERLQASGALRLQAVVCPTTLGIPHEVHVEGAPTHKAAPAALRALAHRTGTVRALAAGRVTFTLRGADPDALATEAEALAAAAGLENIRTHLVVATYTG